LASSQQSKKTDTPQTIYLKDFTAPAFLIDTVDPDFVIETSPRRARKGTGSNCARWRVRWP
jgi:hypothetical protein